MSVTAAAEDLRPLLFSIAYRMVGTVGDAEDLVQESLLRMYAEESAGTEIESPKAFLTTVVTRLAIDHLRSARVRREEYVGEWLPEPIVEDVTTAPAESAELRDSLSLAFLVVLETLSPIERAVFLLHDVFDYGFAEIAEIVERNVDACRQIASRARRRVDERRPRYEPSQEEIDSFVRRFFAALSGGVRGEIAPLLADEVVFHGDGGGKAPAIARALDGAERVSRFLATLGRQAGEMSVTVEPAVVNGQPGAIGRTADGQVISVLSLRVADGRLQEMYSVVNPDKLQRVGDVGDLGALLKARRNS